MPRAALSRAELRSILRTYVTSCAVALAAVLCAPAGVAAGWGSYGSAEPDTHYDRDGGTMWTDAPGATSDRVYFNVYAAQGPDNVAAVNSATLGSRLFGSPLYATFDALLGVWADCNHDGYVGLGDTGALEYVATASEAAGRHVVG